MAAAAAPSQQALPAETAVQGGLLEEGAEAEGSGATSTQAALVESGGAEGFASPVGNGD